MRYVRIWIKNPMIGREKWAGKEESNGPKKGHFPVTNGSFPQQMAKEDFV